MADFAKRFADAVGISGKVEFLDAEKVAAIYRKHGKNKFAEEYTTGQLNPRKVFDDLVARRKEYETTMAELAEKTNQSPKELSLSYVAGIRPYLKIERDLLDLMVPNRQIVVTVAICVIVAIVLVVVNWYMHKAFMENGMHENHNLMTIFGGHLGLGVWVAGPVVTFLLYLMYDAWRELINDPISPHGEKYLFMTWRPSGLWSC